MRHKRQIIALLAAVLFLVWGLTTSTRAQRDLRGKPDGVSIVVSTLMVGATGQPVTQATGMPQRGSITLTPSQSAAVNPELKPYVSGLLPQSMQVIDLVPNATKYDLDLTIEADLQHVQGAQTVIYVNRGVTPLAEIMLRLYPNTEYLGGSMQIHNVTVNGADATPAPFVRLLSGISLSESIRITDTSVMSIPLTAPLFPGQKVTLSLAYDITIPLQSNSGYRTFGWADQVLALPEAYAMIPIHDQNGWYVDATPDYGDIVFSEVSFYRVRITLPTDLVIVATGNCTQTSFDPRAIPPSAALQHQTTISCDAGPVRDFAIHASREYHVVTQTIQARGGDVLVSSYYLPGNLQAAQHVLEYASSALLYYDTHFGAYPYRDFKVFASAVTAGGIEYPMLAGVLDTLYGYGADPTYLEWIVAHEVAHQWWYGMVGSDQINEPWLDESLAQYSTLLYMEHRYGVDFANTQRELRMIARYHAELSAGKDAPVDQPTMGFDRNLYFPIIYGKGPLFYDEVRRYVGDDQFQRWLRLYFDRHRYGIVHREDLLAAADEMGMGVTVRLAFDKWMHGLFIR